MGIDKSLGGEEPYVIINGQVFNYGKVPDWSYEHHGCEKPYPDEWIVEHFSDAKVYYCFHSEKVMRDFVDGLPDTADPPIEANLEPYHTHDKWGNVTVTDRAGWDAELERVRVERDKYFEERATANRTERPEPLNGPPSRQIIHTAADDIMKIVERHLLPYDQWQDPDIRWQAETIIFNALKKYWEVLQSPAPPPELYERCEPSDSSPSAPHDA